MAVADELLNKVTWKIPNALVLIGSRAGEERNAMTASWVTQLSMEPVLVGVGVDNDAVTHRLAQGRCAYVHVARGAVKVNGTALKDGDGARVENESSIELKDAREAEVLLFDLP